MRSCCGYREGGGLRLRLNPAYGLSHHDDAAIVSSTVVLSKQLRLPVIAEGIENRATADLLATMGCEEGQGYFFGRPMPVTEFERQFLASPDKSIQMLAS
jgi:EAL domain-containing protein (putative c-di-GMP-specific phosphodiesterase class I)